ncbi:MAG: hypothetical protein MZV64_13935 [Ignavibacteriales bacterium]|nr:hypothetical protein [Ignavibacteriales bacterium]
MNQEAIDVAIEQCLMLRLRHRRRGAHRPEAVPRRLDPDRLPAHRDRRRERQAAVPRARRSPITQVSVEEDSCREVSDKGHLHRLAHRPPGHAAHRDGHRARPAHARTRCEDAILLVRPRLPHRRGHVRIGHRRQPPGRERLGARRPPRRDQGRARRPGWAPRARPRRGVAPGATC